MVDYEYDITGSSSCRHKNYIFHRSLMFLLFYICLYYAFNKHLKYLFMSYSRWGRFLDNKANPNLDTLPQGANTPRYHLSGCLENIFHRVITQFVKVMKRIVHVNVKWQKHQTSAKKCLCLQKLFRAISYP